MSAKIGWLTDTNQPPSRTPLPTQQNLSSIPEVVSPILQTPAAQNPSQDSGHRTILVQTPGQRAAAQMAIQFDVNIALATPGPMSLLRWVGDLGDRVLAVQPLRVARVLVAVVVSPAGCRLTTVRLILSLALIHSEGVEPGQVAHLLDAKFFFGLHMKSGSQKCRLCSVVYAKTSSLTTRRAHLEKKHTEEYLTEIQRRGWENKLPSALLDKLKQSRMLAAQCIPFSTQELAKMIVKLIVAHDLSLNLIESREFCDLHLFLREVLGDQDIPHLTKLCSLIIEEWAEYWAELKIELNSALGWLCFTGDMWSSLGMHPYFAITVHWLSHQPDTGHVVL
ncbi:hypothetical protein C8R45DRAFT_934384 [Mycena sanguinolenta]|nr:hypothetical protein C8R45DRAFT_934384 [Mycena sanguinolenta]